MNEMLAYAADLAEYDVFWWRDQYNGRLRAYPHDVVVVDYDQYSMLGSAIRSPSKMGGEASMRFCLDAIDAAQKKLVDAVVTAPIAKESWKLAGYHYPGPHRTVRRSDRTRGYTMMFAGGPLKVVLATVHIPLMGMWGKLNIGAVFQPIELLHQALVEWFDIPKPRIAVCGRESACLRERSVRRRGRTHHLARHGDGPRARHRRHGPYPPDTIFLRAPHGQFDAVVAMYHDQGLIPVKLLAFDRAVNMTLGLPIIRTSPDHGTAFDIVGRNRANPGSMRAAIELAIDLAVKRHRVQHASQPLPKPE